MASRVVEGRDVGINAHVIGSRGLVLIQVTLDYTTGVMFSGLLEMFL